MHQIFLNAIYGFAFLFEKILMYLKTKGTPITTVRQLFRRPSNFARGEFILRCTSIYRSYQVKIHTGLFWATFSKDVCSIP